MTKTVSKLKLQVMNGQKYNLCLDEIVENYICLESLVLKLVNHYSGEYCDNCSSICCEIDICRETIDSKFLSLVVQKAHSDVAFDNSKGWMTINGCKLKNGRPLVCYDYFCNIIDNRCAEISSIKPLIKEFISICNNVYARQNLIFINNLKFISKNKISKINTKIMLLKSKVANHLIQVTPKSGAPD